MSKFRLMKVISDCRNRKLGDRSRQSHNREGARQIVLVPHRFDNQNIDYKSHSCGPHAVKDLSGIEHSGATGAGKQRETQRSGHRCRGHSDVASHKVQRKCQHERGQHGEHVSHNGAHRPLLFSDAQGDRRRDGSAPEQRVLEREGGAVEKHAANVSASPAGRKVPTIPRQSSAGAVPVSSVSWAEAAGGKSSGLRRPPGRRGNWGRQGCPVRLIQLGWAEDGGLHSWRGGCRSMSAAM